MMTKVMTFNMWGAGKNAGKPIDETVAVMKAVDADIYAVQETRREPALRRRGSRTADDSSVAKPLADAIGYYVFEPQTLNDAILAMAVISRYPISAPSASGLSMQVDIDGHALHILNVHVPAAPYQPYQLLGIPYDDAPFLATEQQLIEAAEQARNAGMDLLFAEMDRLTNADTTLVFGDFNEPSHLDWTERAAALGNHPLTVRYPASARLADAGFDDVYRVIHPDEISHPGYTWSPTTAADDPADHHDRIDYIYLRGDSARITDAKVVGESAANADIVVTPWPSDHRAVVATVELY